MLGDKLFSIHNPVNMVSVVSRTKINVAVFENFETNVQNKSIYAT